MSVLGISTDSVYAHKVFTEISPLGRRVSYPLAADRSGRMAGLYGALDPAAGVARRTTVLVSPQAEVEIYLVYPREVGRSARELLRVVLGVQYARATGLGVPADWQPGGPGLRRDIALAGMV